MLRPFARLSHELSHGVDSKIVLPGLHNINLAAAAAAVLATACVQVPPVGSKLGDSWPTRWLGLGASMCASADFTGVDSYRELNTS